MPIQKEEGKKLNTELLLASFSLLQDVYPLCPSPLKSFPLLCKNMARGQAPPEDSRCSVCLGCLNNPVVLRCNHRLCWSCVQSYWKRTRALKCPVCLEETLCRVTLQNVRAEMSGSKSGNVFMEKTGDKTVSACLLYENY